jgi:hypothetical protein
MPGTYSVRLTAGGVAQTQALMVKMDPRLKTPREGLAQQFSLSMRLYEAIGRVHDRIVSIEGNAGTPSGRTPANGQAPAAALRRLHDQLLSIYGTLQDADVTPTLAVVAAAEALLDKAGSLP